MKSEMMTQCLMTNEVGFRYVAYIPSKFAEVGKIIDIDDVAEGLTVEAVYHSMPYHVVNERSQDYKKTRQASDI
jgi:hypothetical protein